MGTDLALGCEIASARSAQRFSSTAAIAVDANRLYQATDRRAMSAATAPAPPAAAPPSGEAVPWAEFEAKMAAQGLSRAAVDASPPPRPRARPRPSSSPQPPS